MAAAPLVTQLNFPKVIDISNGSSMQSFSIGLAPGVLGTGVFVRVSFDYALEGFSIGEIANGGDTFTDATPNYASSTYEFSGAYAAGEYTIRSLDILDDVGHWFYYSGAELQAMGFQSSFTVVDLHVPAAPTVGLNVAPNGLLEGTAAVFDGVAGAGEVVTVTALTPFEIRYVLGTATADANGRWSLSTGPLPEGHFTQVVATANANGHTSTHSTPLDFYILTAPVATTIQIAHGTDGVVNAAKPLIWGTARADSTVTLFDGGKAIATVETDQEGWWGLTPGVLSSGAHQLTAQVNDQFGRASPLSAAVDVRVAATAGISYVVGSVSDKSGQALDVGKLQAVLDAVSALTSSVLDGTQTISLKVSVGEVTAEDYIAAAGAKFHSAASDAGMPSITDARLDLSPEFAKAINEGKFLTSYAIEVLTHEMMHVLGMNADPSSAYQAQVKKVGADWYYEGFSARALNGGSVLLASDGTHLPEYSWDLMDPTYRSYIDYLKSDNQTAPYSALDLAILKQLGYHNKDTLVSDDGHRYLAGNGKAGHDTVTGIAGRDTLYVDGKTTGHTINLTSTGFNVKDNVGDGGTLKLSGIERIYFNDNPVALDVGTGQIGGMTYRLYQAAFDRAPDKAGLGYWIDSMDRGLSLKAVAHEFMASKEFAKLYGAKPSDADFLGQLYGNVLHRKPDSAGQAYWLDQMQHGQTKEDVLVNFSESKENVAQLVGVLQNGFAYEYYRGA